MALLIGAAIGSIIGGIIIGGILGNLIGPIGWRYCYGIGFVLAMGTLIYYYFNGIDPERGRSDPELKDFEGEIEYDYKITFDSLIQILKKKTIMGLYLYYICVGVTGASLGTWTIYYLSTKISLSPEKALLSATLILLIGGNGAVIGTALGGKWGDFLYRSGKIKGRVIISVIGLISGALFTFIFYLILPFNTETFSLIIISIIIFIIFSFIGGFLSSLCVGNVFAIISEVCVPELRSTTNAFLGVMVNIGGVFGVLIFASLIDFSEDLFLFAISLVLFIWLFRIFFWIVIYVNYPREAQELRDIMVERRKELDKTLNKN